MLSALYYPNIQLSTNDLTSLRILKRALLMWDHLEFIDNDFPPPGYNDVLVAEAIELIGKYRPPNEEEKNAAHERIEEFVTRPHLPEYFYYKGTDPYEIYPEKFLPKTWQLLQESKHAGELSPSLGYPVNNQFGFTMMAILADSCAGQTRSLVTNRSQSHASLANLFITHEDDTRDRLIDANLRTLLGEESIISLRLSLPDIDRLSLQGLINFRKKEALENGRTLREMRHKYVNHLETHVKEITSNSELSKSDLDELEDQYFQKSLDDLAALKDGLAEEFRENVTKNVIITVLAGIGTVAAATYPLAAPIINGVTKAFGAPVTISGALSAWSKYEKARANVLREHPLALLYELQNE